jgi:adenosylcobinamide-GDP ribazoletransferase
MTDNNSHSPVQLADIGAAFSLLTRIPVPVDHERAGARAAQSVWAYPLVGAVIGFLAAVVGSLALVLGAPETIAAALTLGSFAMLTGAMHEDGLADCADGLGGSSNKTRALEIMKDSRIGAFGAVALCVALITRWSGILELTLADFVYPLIAVGAVSRLPMVLAMYLMPNARKTGLSQTVGQPPFAAVGVASIISFLIALIAMGWAGIIVLGWAILGALPLFVWAQKRLGGQTGDILGGSQQCAEICALAACVALLS